MNRPWILIGNPENRRVTSFQEALVEQGQPPAKVVSWLDVIHRPEVLERLPREPAIVRIDSAGENFAVEQALLTLGFEGARRDGASTIHPRRVTELQHDHGRILCPRQHHHGFLVVLARLRALFANRPDWRVLNPPDSIAELFDKRLTSRRYEALGIPVPPRLDGVNGLDALRAQPARSIFVKVTCGSSASCLALYRRSRSGAEEIITTIEMARTGWYNTLRVRRYRDEARIRAVLEFLLGEGSIVEAEVPKARLGRDLFDCRVVVIAGEPVFTVVRQSELPITNLHLGGRRGDPDALRAAALPDVIATAMESCRKVWRAHRSFTIGVDLMYEVGFAGHRIIEANAFGDLLPNLTSGGLSVYAWQIRQASE